MDPLSIALICIGILILLLILVFIYANLPTTLTLGNQTPTAAYLNEGKLRLTETGKNGL